MHVKKISVLAIAIFLISINVSAKSNPISLEAGDITFATLNTLVDGDQSSHLIDATIIDGNYKGAKLHGKIISTKSNGGDPDRVSLTFTSMNINGKSKPVKIAAYAIDVDTARTALRGKVSHEYLQQNGVILAASFIQSYARNNNHTAPLKVKINAGTDVGILFTSKSD